jgi:acetyl-CoA carboxylase carboxyltransferase component
VGEVFDPEVNPGRKRPFAIRSVMGALVDADAVVSERWRTMADANTAVVWESRIGGHAVTLIGMESRPLPRLGGVPVDGPSEWAGGTLYPLSSKKVARAIRSASGNRPVVVLANLSGFDGSPESLRRLQLEYGAEIARAVVDFDGPIVFVVIGRYHGGAYVVFSKELHPRLTALALEGSYASVIGGAPAAAVVLTREVRARVEADPSVRSAREALAAAGDGDTRLRHVEQLEATLAETTTRVRADVASEFDAVHTVERAVDVGSLDGVIATPDLRPAVVSVLDREATADGRRVPRKS